MVTVSTLGIMAVVYMLLFYRYHICMLAAWMSAVLAIYGNYIVI